MPTTRGSASTRAIKQQILVVPMSIAAIVLPRDRTGATGRGTAEDSRRLPCPAEPGGDAPLPPGMTLLRFMYFCLVGAACRVRPPSAPALSSAAPAGPAAAC